MKIKTIEDIEKVKQEIKELEEIFKPFTDMIKEDLMRRGGIDKKGVYIQGIKDRVYIQDFK